MGCASVNVSGVLMELVSKGWFLREAFDPHWIHLLTSFNRNGKRHDDTSLVLRIPVYAVKTSLIDGVKDETG